MKIRPLRDRILVRRHEAINKTPGGIHLPDAAQQKPLKGTVISVGPGKVLDNGSIREIQIKEGDVVLFSQYTGQEVEVENEKLLIMSEAEVIAVEEKS